MLTNLRLIALLVKHVGTGENRRSGVVIARESFGTIKLHSDKKQTLKK
jgi:hypothetical protein